MSFALFIVLLIRAILISIISLARHLFTLLAQKPLIDLLNSISFCLLFFVRQVQKQAPYIILRRTYELPLQASLSILMFEPLLIRHWVILVHTLLTHLVQIVVRTHIFFRIFGAVAHNVLVVHFGRLHYEAFISKFFGLNLKSFFQNTANVATFVRIFVEGVCFVDKPIHMFVSSSVRLINFVIKQFAVVNTESSVLCSNSDHFVNHIKSIARHFCLMVLFTYHI